MRGGRGTGNSSSSLGRCFFSFLRQQFFLASWSLRGWSSRLAKPVIVHESLATSDVESSRSLPSTTLLASSFSSRNGIYSLVWLSLLLLSLYPRLLVEGSSNLWRPMGVRRLLESERIEREAEGGRLGSGFGIAKESQSEGEEEKVTPWL